MYMYVYVYYMYMTCICVCICICTSIYLSNYLSILHMGHLLLIIKTDNNNNNNNNENNDNNDNTHNRGSWAPGASPPERHGSNSHMRNLLGWLRLGWLKIP